jgi:electron transfer flavoprotein beta subunit
MALGIDRAILLQSEREWDGQATASAIVEAIEAERAAGTTYDLIFFGNESADAGNYQVGIRVAHAFGLPCVTGVKGVAVEGGGLRLEQEVPGGRDVYRVPLPVVVTVKEGLNLPRYPSVPGRLRAKKKPLETRTPTEVASRVEKLKLVLPPGQGKQTQILGEGPSAAPAVVEVLRQAGVL